MKKNAGFRMIAAACIAAFSFAINDAKAVIGANPDPNDICPVPNCSTAGVANIANLVQDINNGTISINSLDSAQLQGVLAQGGLPASITNQIPISSLGNATGLTGNALNLSSIGGNAGQLLSGANIPGLSGELGNLSGLSLSQINTINDSLQGISPSGLSELAGIPASQLGSVTSLINGNATGALSALSSLSGLPANQVNAITGLINGNATGALSVLGDLGVIPAGQLAGISSLIQGNATGAIAALGGFAGLPVDQLGAITGLIQGNNSGALSALAGLAGIPAGQLNTVTGLVQGNNGNGLSALTGLAGIPASQLTAVSTLIQGNATGALSALGNLGGLSASQTGALTGLIQGNATVALSALGNLSGLPASQAGSLTTLIQGNATGALSALGNLAALPASQTGALSSLIQGNATGALSALGNFAGLPASQLGTVTGLVQGNDTAALTTLGGFSSLSASQLSAVTGVLNNPDPTQSLAAQLVTAGLPTSQASAVASLSSSQLGTVTGALNSGLSTASLGQLGNIASLPSSQLGAFTSLLTGNTPAALSAIGSIAGLSTSQLGAFGSLLTGNTPATLSAIGSIAGLSTSQLGAFTSLLNGNTTAGLSAIGSIAGLPASQLGAFTNVLNGNNAGLLSIAGSIAGLPSNQLGALSGLLNGGFNPASLSAIGSFAGLPASQIGTVTGFLNGGLSPASLTALGTLANLPPGQLSAVANVLNTGLNSTTLGSLTTLAGLPASQTSAINSILNGGLSTQSLGALGSIAGLPADQFGAVANVLNGGLSPASLTGLSSLTGISAAQLSAVNSLLTNGFNLSDLSNVAAISQFLGNSPLSTLASLPGLQGLTLGNLSLGNAAGLIGSAGSSTPNEDTRYATMKIHGTMLPINNGVLPDRTAAPYNPALPLDPGMQGVMSSAPAIANRNTPALSLVTNFPWLYLLLDGESQDPLYRNSDSGATATYRASALNATTNTNAQDTQFAATQQTIDKLSGDADALNLKKCGLITDKCTYSAYQTQTGTNLDFEHYPVWIRLANDSCTNQYIIPMGLNPNFIFSTGYRSDEYPWNETMCQPLVLKPLDCERDANAKCKVDPGESDQKMYDYRAWGYLELAWNDVLIHDYIPTGGVSQDDQGTNPVSNQGGNLIGHPQLVSSSQQVVQQDLQLSIAGAASYGSPFNPALPGGSNYQAPDSPKGKLTTINQLATEPFERIWDPTHPFSPRWDWKGTDRDYSEQANLNGTIGHGYDLNLGGTCTVRCAAVPVDILSFRADAFAACMNCRINANTACFWNEVAAMQVYLGPWYVGVDPVTAYIDTLNNILPFAPGPWPLWGIPQFACKTTYDLQNAWPVCSTKYDTPNDNVPSLCSSCVALSGDSNPNGGVKKCCDNLAKALAPINTLKIRNTKENPILEPVPEGYRFKDYFSAPPQNLVVGGATTPGQTADKVVHMPYMRWWDAGTAAGGTTDSSTNYNPNCDLGSYDVIVGVGTDGDKGGTGAKYCRFGGNGTSNQYSCYNLPQTIDGLTSWEELKQYQARAMRDLTLNCLPQYEKFYKKMGAEDNALFAAGGTFPRKEKDDTLGQVRIQGIPFPIPWLGYLTDTDNADRLPNFNGGLANATSLVGLDNAKKGDIVYLTFDDVAPKVPNVDIYPFVGVVYGTKLAGQCDDYVQIYDVNNGKLPDVCGNTDYLGNGQPRKIFKSHLPAEVYEKLYQAGEEVQICNPATNQEVTYTVTTGVTGLADGLGLAFQADGDCKDTKMGVCMFNQSQGIWNKVRIYRPIRTSN